MLCDFYLNKKKKRKGIFKHFPKCFHTAGIFLHLVYLLSMILIHIDLVHLFLAPQLPFIGGTNYNLFFYWWALLVIKCFSFFLSQEVLPGTALTVSWGPFGENFSRVYICWVVGNTTFHNIISGISYTPIGSLRIFQALVIFRL